MSQRHQDNKAEAIIAEFLDKHFYPKFVTDFHRHKDLESQLHGIDVYFRYAGRDMHTDEKSAVHYVNKNLPTFAFEVDFINREGKPHQGWLFDPKKKTTHYLLTWIWADKDKHFTVDDINKVELMIIEREAIVEMLESHGMTEEAVNAIAKDLRKNEKYGLSYKTKKPFYFFFTEHLREKPINIIVHKRELVRRCLLYRRMVRRG